MRDVLCYGDSNTWGCRPGTGPGPPRRFGARERWPGVLRRELGSEYRVVEEGLNGRTTVWEDSLERNRNGRELLLPVLLRHMPLDLVIVMLGTNDLKHRFGASARAIAEGAGMLVDDVRGSACGPDGAAPQVLLICPPPFARSEQPEDEFEGAAEKSRRLAPHYAAIAEDRGCAFLDAGTHVRASASDGIHLDRSAHAVLGRAVATTVRAILPDT